MKKTILVLLSAVLAVAMVLALVACNRCETNGHKWEDAVTKAPTCGDPGVLTRTCIVCGEVQTEQIPATGNHRWGEWGAGSTAGVEERECSVCHQKDTRNSGVTGCEHALNNVPAKAPDCTNAGNIEYWKCSKCNKLFSDANATTEIQLEDTVRAKDPAAHNYGTWIPEDRKNDCTQESTVGHYHCDICGKNFDADKVELSTIIIPATHTPGTWIEATVGTDCTHAGDVAHSVCEVCHQWLDADDQVIPESERAGEYGAHSNLDKVNAQAPTCGDDGVIVHWYCSACEKYYADNDGVAGNEIDEDDTVDPATGNHNYTLITHVVNTWTHAQTCSVCGEQGTTSACSNIVLNKCQDCNYTYTEKEIVDALYALGNVEKSMDGTFALTGTVTRIQRTASYTNVWYTVDGREIEAYGIVDGEEATADIIVGSVITVHGTLKSYYATKEIVDCTLEGLEFPEYDITVNNVQHATVSEIVTKAYVGETITFTVTCDEGYKISVVTINGELLDAQADGSYQFVVEGNTAIVITVVEDVPEVLTEKDATYDTTAQGYDNAQDVTEKVVGDITFTFSSGSKYYNTGTAVRVYGGSNVTVTVPVGYYITKITITFGKDDNGDGGANAITANRGTYSNGVWTGKTSSVTLTVGGSSGHRRMMKFDVEYLAPLGEGECAHDWKWTHNDNAWTHTRTCSKCQETETANCSPILSVCPTCEYTYTDKEAVDAIYARESGSLPGTYKLTGEVTKIRYTWTSNYGISFDMTTGGKSIYVYQLKNGDDLTSIVVGDTVVISGTLTIYNSDKELTGCNLIARNPQPACEHVGAQLTPAVAPDCTNAGNIAYWYCGTCQKYFADNNNAIGNEITQQQTVAPAVPTAHKYGTLNPAVPGTDCQHEGTVAYYHCSACNKNFNEAKDTVLESLSDNTMGAHNYGTLHPAVGGTDCEHEGTVAYYQCSVCDKYFNEAKDTVLESLSDNTKGAHDYGTLHPAVGGTDCQHEGNVAYYQCSVCSKYFNEEHSVLESISDNVKGQHVYESYVDIGEGQHAKKCKFDESIDESTKQAHDEKEYVINVNNTHTVKCSVCHAVIRDNEAHEYVQNEDGQGGKCACGNEDPKYCAHSSRTEHKAAAATCTTDELKAYWECDNCHKAFATQDSAEPVDDNYFDGLQSATGHSWKLAAQDAWTWADNHETVTLHLVCDNGECGETNDITLSEVITHQVTTNATCTVKEVTTYTINAEMATVAAMQGFKKTDKDHWSASVTALTDSDDVEGEALGHDYAEEYTEDKENPGKHYHVCNNDPSHHDEAVQCDLEWKWSDDNHWQKCTECTYTTTQVGHDVNDEVMDNDSEGHWYVCAQEGCNVHYLYDTHDGYYGEVYGHNSDNHWNKCSECEYEDKDKVVGHTYTTYVTRDNETHTYACVCGEQDIQSHEMEWISVDDQHMGSCDCGYDVEGPHDYGKDGERHACVCGDWCYTAQPGDFTITPSDYADSSKVASGDNITSGANSTATLKFGEDKGITITFNQGSGNTAIRWFQYSTTGAIELRVYNNSSFTITANNLTKIVVNYRGSNYLNADGYTSSGTKGTWEGTAESVSFSVSGSMNITSIVIYYDVDTVDHNWQEQSRTPEVDCASQVTYKCARCGIDKTETVVNHNIELKNGQVASCTQQGWVSHYECTKCTKWFTSAADDAEEMTKSIDEKLAHEKYLKSLGDDQHQELCRNCDEYQGAISSHDKSYGKDDNNHWFICNDGCDLKGAEEGHSYETDDTCVCGKPNPNTHTTHTTEQNKWASDGEQHWRICDTCGEEVDNTRGTHSYSGNSEYEDGDNKQHTAKCDECSLTATHNSKYTDLENGQHSITCDDELCEISLSNPHDDEGDEGACSKCGYKKSEPQWVLVNSTSELSDGDKIVIVGKDVEIALSTNQASSNRTGTAITKKDNTITMTESVQEIVLERDSSGNYALHMVTGTTGYLYASSSSSNQLKTQSTNNANGLWKITVTNGTASIVATGTNTRNTMQYNANNGSPIFNCYASASQTAIQIYRYDDGTTGGGTTDPDQHTCTSKCTTCQLCTNTSCQQEACLNKCKGHDSQIPAHITDKEIDDLVANAPENLKYIYEVTGIWVPTGNDSDQYGNGKLIDKSSGNELVIYGMAPTESAFSYNSATGEYKFTNPKAFQDIKSQFAAGDEIKIGVAYNTSFSNYYSYYIDKMEVAANILYDVKLTYNDTLGQVSLSQSTGLVYGDEVTITVTPNANYKVGSVTFNGVGATKVNDNTYKFNVTVAKNEIVVNFAEATQKVLKTLTIDLTSTTTSGISSTANTAVASTQLNGITYKYLNLKQNSGYVMFNKSSSWFANETKIDGTIVKVEFTIQSGSSGSAAYYITIGTTQMLEAKSTGTTANQKGLGTGNKMVAEVDEAQGGSYFNISQVSSYNGQIKTITVSYYEA
ncbi:MAG: hypothetical protein J1G02_01260 [Clostridiales bacterium]|nr:hypothetical protein [Clostridiales bacterium]